MNRYPETPASVLHTTSVIAALMIIAVTTMVLDTAWAGPPFLTDDPEPVELHHWEVYVASFRTSSPSGDAATVPHIEINNGAAPNLQLHIITPCGFSRDPSGVTHRGYGDTELGAKVRFVQETARRPMAGIFPFLEVPTGNADRGLGSGHYQMFLPLWLQKSHGPWTSYGGAGYWVNPGDGNRNYWFSGIELQRDLNDHLTLGGELFHSTPSTTDGTGQTGFNIGGQFNFDDGHHFLFSVGRMVHGEPTSMRYVAYQWTFGPQ